MSSAQAGTSTSGGLSIADSATQSLTFRRLFGDAAGNKTANPLDYAKFKLAFGSSTGSAAYNADLDFDGNGTITALGYAQFKKRIGLTFAYS